MRAATGFLMADQVPQAVSMLATIRGSAPLDLDQKIIKMLKELAAVYPEAGAQAELLLRPKTPARSSSASVSELQSRILFRARWNLSLCPRHPLPKIGAKLRPESQTLSSKIIPLSSPRSVALTTPTGKSCRRLPRRRLQIKCFLSPASLRRYQTRTSRDLVHNSSDLGP